MLLWRDTTVLMMKIEMRTRMKKRKTRTWTICSAKTEMGMDEIRLVLKRSKVSVD